MSEAVDRSLRQGLIPKHVAVVMDGNRRWARQRDLPIEEGYRAGAQAARKTVLAAQTIGIEYITMFTFSTENWHRPGAEVAALMGLLVEYVSNFLEELDAKNVRVRAVGDLSAMPTAVQKSVHQAITATRNNAGVTAIFALNYGGRWDILQATRRVASQARREREASTTIDEHNFARHLATGEIPDPELIIRAGGERRLSNFLLYQSSHAKFWCTDRCWPDFGADELCQAIEDFQKNPPAPVV